METAKTSTIRIYKPSVRCPSWVVVIGAGAGGPQSLAQLLPLFAADLPATIVVCQHMRRGFTRVLADLLGPMCKMLIYELEHQQALQTSRIVIAPASSRLTIANVGDSAAPAYNLVIEETGGDSPEHTISQIDVAMASAAKAFGARAIGVLLSGFDIDGCEGMRAIRNAGGLTIVQDEASSTAHYMPASAICAGVVQQVLPLWGIADHITSILRGEADANAA